MLENMQSSHVSHAGGGGQGINFIDSKPQMYQNLFGGGGLDKSGDWVNCHN